MSILCLSSRILTFDNLTSGFKLSVLIGIMGLVDKFYFQLWCTKFNLNLRHHSDRYTVFYKEATINFKSVNLNGM